MKKHHQQTRSVPRFIVRLIFGYHSVRSKQKSQTIFFALTFLVGCYLQPNPAVC